MLPYRVGDYVYLNEDDSGAWEDNKWVVVQITGSKLMLKRGLLRICGVHADEVALCEPSSDDSAVARSAPLRPEGPACNNALS